MQIYEIGANIGANIFILIYKLLFINILSITILYLSRRRSRVRVPSIPPQILVKVPAKRGLFSRPYYFTLPVFNRKNSVTFGGETFHLHHSPHRNHRPDRRESVSRNNCRIFAFTLTKIGNTGSYTNPATTGNIQSGAQTCQSHSISCSNYLLKTNPVSLYLLK